MKRARKTKKRTTQKTMIQSFDYNSLLSEMQAEVRSHASPASKVLLALTCKEEYILGIQSKIIGGGDDHLLLAALVQSRLAKTFKHLCSCVRALIPSFGPVEPDVTSHYLVHLAINARNHKFLDWLQYSRDFKPCYVRRCDQCLQMAAQQDDRLLIKRIYNCSFSVASAWRPAEILTVEAIRQNNSDLFFWLEKHGHVASCPNFAWDLSDNKTGYWTNEGRAIAEKTLDWWDLYDALCRMDTLLSHSNKSIMRPMIYSMIHRQWTFAAIDTFIEENMQMERDRDLYDIYIPFDGLLRTEQETFWWDNIEWLIGKALFCKNMDVLEQGLRRFPRARWNYSDVPLDVIQFLYEQENQGGHALGQRLLLPIQDFIKSKLAWLKYDVEKANLYQYLIHCRILVS